MAQNIVLYGETAARVYPLSMIYDPDRDPPIADTSGKIIPAVSSLVVDDTVGLHNQLYVVQAVDPITKKSILVPAVIVQTPDGANDRILSYGNDIYMLYFSTVTIKDDKGVLISLTKCAIDDKLALFGNHSAKYQLVRTNLDGTQVVISQNFDASGKNRGTFGDIVPAGPVGVRKCNSCYSYCELAEGENIGLHVYDAAGILLTIIKLITKKALILSELSDESNPIVKFDILANQMIDEDIIMYAQQNMNELALYPEITYADGTTIIVGIDKRVGFIYGLEDVSTKTAGLIFTISAKYYIAEDIPSKLPSGVGPRHISCSKTIRIIDKSKYTIAKISVVPHLNNKRWDLLLFTYKTNRKGFNIATKTSSIICWDPDTKKWEVPYNPTLLDKAQNMKITTTQIDEDTGQERQYNQELFLEHKSLNPTNMPPFLIKALDSDPTFNDNNPPHICPRINYGLVTKAGVDYDAYYIDPYLFTENTTQSAVDVFLENFYYNAKPPLSHLESEAPRPTHFTIRNPLSGRSLLQMPREVSKFSEPLDLLAITDEYVGNTVLIEFWVENTPTTYSIIYGVPVVVIKV